MIKDLREAFNANFTPEKHARFLDILETAVGEPIEFRPCETPLFLPAELLTEMTTAAREIIEQLRAPEYLAASARAIPAEFNAPNEGAHPDFVQVDFAVTRDENGRLAPRLIELQGCASLYAFQHLLPSAYRQVYDLDGLAAFLSGLDEASYAKLLRRVVVGEHAPDSVVLMEIDPDQQKTRPDFWLTEKMLGVRTVDVRDVRQRGRELFYEREGRLVRIARLYNRVIVDELISKGVRPGFDFRHEFDVEWAGHPNWYFRLSKFSLPYLKHRAVPRAWFLDQLDAWPDDLDRFVLKPLFSFAGRGVRVDVARAELDAIPVSERGDYLLQEKVDYAPAVATPTGPSKVEVRVMFLWPQGGEPTPVTLLTRFSKGALMGVDFNKNKTWVGSSCAFFVA